MSEAQKSRHQQLHSSRRLARVFALLGVYEWIADPELTAAKITEGLESLIEDEDGGPVEGAGVTTADWAVCDRELFSTLLSGVVAQHAALEEVFAPFVDRDLKRVSLVERSILLLGAYELMHCPQTPYRVVLNEDVELAKRFGSGYRFTNAVLERVAEKVRAVEFADDHAKRAAEKAAKAEKTEKAEKVEKAE